MKNIQAFIIGFLAILIVGAGAANAATWTVTKSTNSSDNICDADCSLREAVAAADSGDTVVFDSNLVGQTFTLGGSEIVISRRITIDGFLNNPNVVFLSGEMTSRIFLIESGGGLILRNMTLLQGNGASVNYDSGSGGAIAAKTAATLSLNRVAIRGNRATVYGAVFLNSGTHRITNSSFTDNSAKNCTAIGTASGDVYMVNVTVSKNYIYENVGGLAGALCNGGGNVYIRHSTIAYNTGNGGISNFFMGTLNLGNTIVAENSAQTAPDIRMFTGTITSAGGNLIGNLDTVPNNTFNQPNDIFGVNPLLAPTNSNLDGFPILSHPLQAGSPARNGGINTNAADPLTNQPLTFDARGTGFPRIADTTVDKGAFEDQSGNTSLVVTKKTNSDDLVCDADCSLREAVHQASLNFGTDTITFAPNVFGTLALGGEQISIDNQNVNIIGYPNLSANTLIVSGSNEDRIFHLSNATVRISGMTLANGRGNSSFGGAILANNSHLTLDKMIVRNNYADYIGGVHINGGSAHITNSTFNNNSAKMGLALGVFGTLNMANTTVSGNLDADGGDGFGAVFVNGTANIRNSTIAFNRLIGGMGSGIFMKGALNIGNSIVAGNIAPAAPDIYLENGAITSIGGNLVQNTNGFPMGTFAQTNDATNVDPLLAALADNGGNVTTHLLQPGSSAINAGINANAVDPFDNSILATDARGTAVRISNVTVDKGAFETSAPTAATVSVSGRVTNGKRGVARARIYMTGQNGETRTALTNSFGYFRLDEVTVGETYIFNVIAKNYIFLTQVITVNEQLDELSFAAETNW